MFQSARHELEAAARWAREKLEAGAKRIGVVVPELAARRREVLRVFARTMNPAHAVPGQGPRALPFDVSLGEPLSDTPLAHAALSILALALGEIPFEQASRLLRSPFVGGGEEEMAARARLDAALRRKAPARLALGKLVGLVEVDVRHRRGPGGQQAGVERPPGDGRRVTGAQAVPGQIDSEGPGTCTSQPGKNLGPAPASVPVTVQKQDRRAGAGSGHGRLPWPYGSVVGVRTRRRYLRAIR